MKYVVTLNGKNYRYKRYLRKRKVKKEILKQLDTQKVYKT